MADQGRTRARSFGSTVLMGLAGAALAAVAGNHGWVHVGPLAMDSRQLPPAAEAARVPLAGALALVLLATWGVVLVTRARTRRVLAVLGVVVSVGLLATAALTAGGLPGAVRHVYETTADYLPDSYVLNGWFYACVLGTVACLVAFVIAVRSAGSWPEMGRRYDAPVTAAPPDTVAGEASDLELWKALDEGHDPTTGSSLGSAPTHDPRPDTGPAGRPSA